MNNFFNYSNYKKQLRRDLFILLAALISSVFLLALYYSVVYAPVIDKCADKMLWK